MIFFASSGMEAKSPGAIINAANARGPIKVTSKNVFLRTRERNSRCMMRKIGLLMIPRFRSILYDFNENITDRR